MEYVLYNTRRKRLLRSIALFTLMGCVLGFVLGIFVGKTVFGVEAKKEPPVVALPIEYEVESVKPEVNTVSIGVCKLTAYCKENYPHICNDGDSSRTATGTTPTVGRTCAVDPKIIPYGSEVIINGHTYIAEDCGGAVKGNRIDILFATHQEALDFGVRYAEVKYVVG